jgi:hypothetical protein
MIELDKKIQMILLLFIAIIGFLYKIKPPQMFESKTGKIKSFGTGPFKTVFPFWLAALCISLLAYVYLSIKEDDFV